MIYIISHSEPCLYYFFCGFIVFFTKNVRFMLKMMIKMLSLRNKINNLIKMKQLFRILGVALAVLIIYSCSEQIDTSARYVFKYDTVLSYLQKHEAYRDYADLLSKVPISKIYQYIIMYMQVFIPCRI